MQAMYGELLHREQGPAKYSLQWDLRELKKLLFGTPFHLLLVFVLPAFLSHYCGWSETLVFVFNFLAMIPMANILGECTESCAEHMGETAGGLLNATFGNAVEMVVMIMALIQARQCDDSDLGIETKNVLLAVVQTSLLGSVFSNSLLVLGATLFFAGMKYKQLSFNVSATSANMSLLFVAVFTMLLPSHYLRLTDDNNNSFSRSNLSIEEIRKINDDKALMVSRVASVIMLIMYMCLLYYQLFTHRDLIDGKKEENDDDDDDKLQNINVTQYNAIATNAKTDASSLSSKLDKDGRVSDEKSLSPPCDLLMDVNNGYVSPQHRQICVVSSDVAADGQHEYGENDGNSEDSDDGGSDMSVKTSVFLLLLMTVMLSLTSDYLVGAIQPLAEKWNISEAFIGIILLPIVGNAVEQMTAVRVALKGKMDIAMQIAIGSSCQIALFVVAFAVLTAWCMGLNLSLVFSTFEQQIFLFTVLIVSAIINHGKADWLKGFILLALYTLVGVAVWNQTYRYYG